MRLPALDPTTASAATKLAELTTLRLGGPVGRFVEPATEAELIETVRSADAAGEPLLVIGAGSNLVVADDGFAGVVLEPTVSTVCGGGVRVPVTDSCGRR